MLTRKKSPEKKPEKSKGRVVLEYSRSIALAVLLALVIRGTVVMAYVIPSGSMKSTLEIGDRIMVSKLAYNFRLPGTDLVLFELGEIERGDVIVFEHPVNHVDYVKRVIGLPGDSIEIKNKHVLVNGRPLSEPYARHTDLAVLPADRETRDNLGPLTVPAGKLFVLGDNRDNSFDSRYWGFVDHKLVKGRAFLRLWSWDSNRHILRWSRFFTSVE